MANPFHALSPKCLPCGFCGVAFVVDSMQDHLIDCDTKETRRKKRKAPLLAYGLPEALLDSFDPPAKDLLVQAASSILEIGSTELFLGGKLAVDGERHWDAVCNAAAEIQVSQEKIDVYCHIEGEDSIEFDLYPYFDRGSQFLNEAIARGDKEVLYMCAKGISRSSTMLIASLMSAKRILLRDAWILVRSKRAIAMPNPSFFRQLMRWEEKIFPGAMPSLPQDFLTIHPHVF